MSMLAACLHKAEWICKTCAKCGGCCQCDADPPELVHINTMSAAQALARFARNRRDQQNRT